MFELSRFEPLYQLVRGFSLFGWSRRGRIVKIVAGKKCSTKITTPALLRHTRRVTVSRRTQALFILAQRTINQPIQVVLYSSLRVCLKITSDCQGGITCTS